MSHRSPDKRSNKPARQRSLSLARFILSPWGVATAAVLGFAAAYLIIIFVIY